MDTVMFKYSKEKLAKMTFHGGFDRQKIKFFLFPNGDDELAHPPSAGGKTPTCNHLDQLTSSQPSTFILHKTRT